MELVTPDFGLIFWMVISFSLVLFILGKFAWKPIMNALDERNRSIEEALQAAERAKQEVANLTVDNERILAEARNERDRIIKEAREIKESIISEAQSKANSESERLIQIARESIQNEKMAAITDLKNQVANISVNIAERLIREKLSDDAKSTALVNDLMKEVNLK
ncbi:MAG TPA: F0F1 ATP synthase subunit B [Bacteroidia bacterium]|nr:F0F1 ATP synthase subunit B [Bacteroidia bacterium]HNT79657.1 F0F1 ATP synthase subunit B [Bacteroidia bacterium]